MRADTHRDPLKQHRVDRSVSPSQRSRDSAAYQASSNQETLTCAPSALYSYCHPRHMPGIRDRAVDERPQAHYRHQDRPATPRQAARCWRLPPSAHARSCRSRKHLPAQKRLRPPRLRGTYKTNRCRARLRFSPQACSRLQEERNGLHTCRIGWRL